MPVATEITYTVEALHLEFTSKEWKQVFAFKQQWAERKRVPLARETWRSLKDRCLRLLTSGKSLFLVWENEMALGTLLLYQKPRLAPEYVFVHHDFVVAYFDQGLIKKVLEAYVSAWPASKYLVLTSTDARNDYLEQSLSLQVSEERELFELKLKQRNNSLMNDWEQKDEFAIIDKAKLPLGQLYDYYSMIRELTGDVTYKSKLFDEEILAPAQIIKREQTYQARGIQQLVLLMLRSDELVGYTEVIVYPEEPTVAYQNMTGIRKQFRGRGLGSWLKVSMIQLLLDKHSEVSIVKTAIHPRNASSQRLNRQLGFRKVGTYKEYIITKESILSQL